LSFASDRLRRRLLPSSLSGCSLGVLDLFEVLPNELQERHPCQCLDEGKARRRTYDVKLFHQRLRVGVVGSRESLVVPRVGQAVEADEKLDDRKMAVTRGVMKRRVAVDVGSVCVGSVFDEDLTAKVQSASTKGRKRRKEEKAT
jgi:hypothetical protein